MRVKAAWLAIFSSFAIAHAEDSVGKKLCTAVRNEDLAGVNRLLGAGVSPNSPWVGENYEINPTHWPLIDAAEKGNLKIIRLLLNHGADVEKSTFPEGFQAIHLAAESGSLAVVTVLLDHGAKVKRKSSGWGGGPYQPIYFAAASGNLELVKYLVKQGAEISEDALAMAGAVSGRNLEIVKFLVDHGGSLNWKNSDGDSLIHSAAGNNDLPMVRFLIEQGADPNDTDPHGTQPIHLAAGAGDLATVTFLLEKGAGANVPADSNEDYYHNGWRPLHFAASHNQINPEDDAKKVSIEITKLLIRRGADVNAPDHEGDTPLHLATDASIATILIENGAKVDNLNHLKEQPLHRAANDGDIPRIKALLAHGAAVEPMSEGGETPLDKAAFWSKKEAMLCLMESGAKPTERTLINAVNFGEIDQVPLLIEHGVKLTANVYLADYRAQEKLFPLLDNEAIIGVSGKVLTDAVEAEDLPKIKTLLAAGVKIDAHSPADGRPDLKGSQPVHHAAFCDDPAVMEFLLKNGAMVDATTESGIQPLHIAATAGKLGIVRSLVAAGADPNHKGPDGKSAIQLAEINHHPQTAKFLRESADGQLHPR